MSSNIPSFSPPASDQTVKVRILNTGYASNIKLSGTLVEESFVGLDNLTAPAFSFLIEHESGRKILFDLGFPKDWEELPAVANFVNGFGWEMKVEKGVREILDENGVSTKDIEAVVWSHWHWDHVGDTSTFEPSTALVVGPGFKDNVLPGYPANPEAHFRESAYEGRELREISFDDSFVIGRFRAMDWFGDGSFYLLDSPGHTIGHIAGLARVTASPPSFILMGGDTCHHGGEFRPSAHLPLPESIWPHPLNPASTIPCPGALLKHVLRDGKNDQPVLTMSESWAAFQYNAEEVEESIKKLGEADAHKNVFVVIAHDSTLEGVVDFFPAYANDFLEKGWVEKSTWRFLSHLTDKSS